MEQLKSKKSIAIIILSIIIMAVTYFSYFETIKYEVTEKLVQEKINDKMPFNKDINIDLQEVIKGKNFIIAKLFKGKYISFNVLINDTVVDFKKESLDVIVNGILTYKKETFPFTIQTTGNVVYDDGKIFYKIETSNANEIVDEMYPIISDKILKYVKTTVSDYEDKGVDVGDTHINVKEVKKSISGLFKKYTNNKILDKKSVDLVDIVEKKINHDKIATMIKTEVDKSIINIMGKTPVYTLDDEKSKENLAIMFLDKIEFKENVMVIHMSLRNITNSIITFIVGLLLAVGIILVLSRNGGLLALSAASIALD